jgi:hypothetical protein
MIEIMSLETENANKIPFLDVLIVHSSDKLRFYYLQKASKKTLDIFILNLITPDKLKMVL